jgi:hypothetical protein
MSNSSRLLSVMAPIDNANAVAEVLVRIRDRASLAQRIDRRETGFAFEYNEETRTGHYLVTDADTLMCFSVTDLTYDEAAAIAAECRPMREWGHEEFQAAAGRALGGYFMRIQ